MEEKKITEKDMKMIGKKVGEDLLKNNGKKKFYSPKEIKDSCRRQKIYYNWHCWAFSFYTDQKSFTNYYESIGEYHNYALMKSKMISALTGKKFDYYSNSTSDCSWLDLTLINLPVEDASNIDFTDLFDFSDILDFF